MLSVDIFLQTFYKIQLGIGIRKFRIPVIRMTTADANIAKRCIQLWTAINKIKIKINTKYKFISDTSSYFIDTTL